MLDTFKGTLILILCVYVWLCVSTNPHVCIDTNEHVCKFVSLCVHLSICTHVEITEEPPSSISLDFETGSATSLKLPN